MPGQTAAGTGRRLRLGQGDGAEHDGHDRGHEHEEQRQSGDPAHHRRRRQPRRGTWRDVERGRPTRRQRWWWRRRRIRRRRRRQRWLSHAASFALSPQVSLASDIGVTVSTARSRTRAPALAIPMAGVPTGQRVSMATSASTTSSPAPPVQLISRASPLVSMTTHSPARGGCRAAPAPPVRTARHRGARRLRRRGTSR